MQESINQSMRLAGYYTIRKAKLVTVDDFMLSEQIAYKRDLGHDISDLLDQLHSQCIVEQFTVPNLITTAGRAALASHLTSGSPTPSVLRANYGALGSNATAPTNADTQLGTETYRNQVASATKSNNIAYLTLFFSATETTGTYNEVGLFLLGSAGANTGTLFSHALISVTKSGTETLTIDYTVTIS